MFSYKLDISYDGTNFHGFQKQSDNITIQGDIEKVLSQLLRDYDLTYSGRTDAGVHAKSQILCLKVNNELKNNFLNSFNSLISNQIKINKIQKVSKNFHPRFDAKSRVYKYFILNKTRELPFSENRVYFVNKNLNINDLNSVSRIFFPALLDLCSISESSKPSSWLEICQLKFLTFNKNGVTQNCTRPRADAKTIYNEINNKKIKIYAEKETKIMIYPSKKYWKENALFEL